MLKPSPQRTVPSSNVTFYLMSYLSPLGFLENLAYRNYNTLFTYWMLQRTPVLGQVPPPEEEDRSPALGALSLEGEIEYGHRWWWELPAVLCAVREGQSWCWQSQPTTREPRGALLLEHHLAMSWRMGRICPWRNKTGGFQEKREA